MNNFFFSFFFFFFFFSILSAYTCPSTCLPKSNCKCGSKLIPGNVKLSEAPQFVFFTIDDAVVETTTYSMLPLVEHFRSNQKIRDANGCSIRPTVYALSKNSDYSLIAYFEKIGTVALHSVTHTTDFETGYNKWRNELETCYMDIKELSKVTNIYGSRAPYLAANNHYYKVLSELKINFDSSSSYYAKSWNMDSSDSEKRNFWPFTLDYGFPEDGLAYSSNLQIPSAVKGLWEVPMTGYHKQSSSEVYELMDIFVPSVAENPVLRKQIMDDLKKDFTDNYNTNRAPLGYYFHMYYFIDNDGNLINHIIAFWDEFLEWVASHSNVLFATEDRAIAWTKNPKQKFSETKAMKEFLPLKNIPTFDKACNVNKRKVCKNPKPIDGRPEYTICGTSCPNLLPEINTLWKYQSFLVKRQYTNNQKYFDVPYNGQTNNLNYPKIPLSADSDSIPSVRTEYIGLGSNLNQHCGIIMVNNGNTNYGGNGYILSVSWCPYNVKFSNEGYYLPRSKDQYKVDFPVGSKSNGFRITGDIKDGFMRVSEYYFGEFCLDVPSGTQFSWENVKAGIEFYRVPLFCSLESTNPLNFCHIGCGNLRCESGETAKNCPIDCPERSC